MKQYWLKVLGDKKDLMGTQRGSRTTMIEKAIYMVKHFPDLKIVVEGEEGVVSYVRMDGTIKWDGPIDRYEGTDRIKTWNKKKNTKQQD